MPATPTLSRKILGLPSTTLAVWGVLTPLRQFCTLNTLIPTSTFLIAIRVDPGYVSPVAPGLQQETTYVTSVSYRW
jgi:hypothetical protein